MIQQPTRVLKKRLLWLLGQALFRDISNWLDHLINVVRLRVTDERPTTAWPRDLDRSINSIRTDRKHPHWLIAGKIAPSRDHLLRLPQVTDGDRYSRADPPGVRRKPAQPNSQAGSHRVVSINQGRLIEAVDDQIQVTVVIEIPSRNAVRHLGRIKPPCLPHFSKTKITQVAIGHIGSRKRREVQRANLLALGLGKTRESCRRITIVDIVEPSISHEQIFVTIEVHIHEHRLPRPICRFHPCIASHLCERAVTAVPKQRVTRHLQSIQRITGLRERRRIGTDLQ